MTTRKKIFAGLALVAVLGILAWEIFRPRIPNPIFEGQRLSYWLGRSDGTESFTVQAAVRDAGTNAIPMLLQFMRGHDSALKSRLIGLIEKQDILSLHLISGDNHDRAILGFEALGAQGRSAIPELLRIYDADPSPDSRMYVIEALGGIGPKVAETKEVIPLLLSETANTNYFTRGQAMRALFRIQMAVPDVIVPLLVKSLSDPRNYTYALFDLGQLGPKAKAAVPGLIEFRKSLPPGTNFWIFKMIDDTLQKIDPAAAANARVQVTNAGPAGQNVWR